MNSFMQKLEKVIALSRYSLRSVAVRNAGYAASGAALLLLLVTLAWWLPARHEHAELEQAIDSRRAAAVEAVRSVEVMRAQLEAKQAVTLLEKKLETSASQADLIQGVAKLATRHSVRVISQSFDEGRGQRNDGSLYMNVSLLGSYDALRGMMQGFATLPMWIEVTEARMDRSSASMAPIRAQLRLLTYRTPRASS